MTLIPIARIVAAHGIKGHVKLKSYARDNATLTQCGALQSADGRAFEITKLKPANDVLIADLKGVKDRNVAEALVGQELFVSRAKLPALKDDEFYLADLIGKDVRHGSGSLGIVASIENYGAGDLMELANGDLVPVAFVTSVSEVVTVDLPPGYLDPATHEDQHH
jgi:16S rRNA processing protein RimM